MYKVAIQGGECSFHDIAANHFFHNKYEMLDCNSFRVVAEKLSKNEVDFAVLAIENSIAGTLLPNYSLLIKHNLEILDELYLKIELHLLTTKKVKVKSLQTIQSHPVAILQCHDFLAGYTEIHVENSTDTADAARFLAMNQNPYMGVIANQEAADKYNLVASAKNIQTNKKNYTRFLLLRKKQEPLVISKNKTSLCLELKNEVGALADLLHIIKNHDLNLTKIQSLPIIGKPQSFMFLLDIVFDDKKQLENAFIESESLILNSINLGYYNKKEIPIN